MTHKRKFDCPTCQKQLIWSEENPYRPFCSRRCQLIDFGDWANERHTIAGEPVTPDPSQAEDDPVD